MGGIPMATMAVTGLCVALHLMVLLTGLDINTMAINAGKVLYSLEVRHLQAAPIRVKMRLSLGAPVLMSQ